MGCTLLIKECLDSLTSTEQRLAAYLLDHTSEVIHMNAKEYASACTSSPAAVVRFSKRLGFKGFTALKLDLARESGQGELDDFQAAIRDNDDMETIVRKAERIHLQNTSLTYQMLNVSILSQAVEEICAGRRIHLFGVGASGLLAMDFLYKSSRIGIPATYHSDAHTNLYRLTAGAGGHHHRHQLQRRDPRDCAGRQSSQRTRRQGDRHHPGQPQHARPSGRLSPFRPR